MSLPTSNESFTWKMEENRRKEIEARLFQLISDLEKPKPVKNPSKNNSASVKVIRRRKGQTDYHIS